MDEAQVGGELFHTNQREELKKLYPNSERWSKKVDKMSDTQVTAIYLKKRAEGKLAK